MNESDHQPSNSTLTVSSNELLLDDEDFDEFVASLRNDSLVEIFLYIILFVSGAIGNLWVFIKQQQKRQRDARVNFLLRHLNYADMLVIFGTILIEIVWRITVYWHGGDILCKCVQTFRIFGVYLSSIMVIGISVDRYYVFVHPLSFINRERRKKILIYSSYVVSAISSLPQAFIFHIKRHPRFSQFTQCLASGYFEQEWEERLYQIFTLCVMYFVPFGITLFCYIRIIIALNLQKDLNITMDMMPKNPKPSLDSAHRISIYERAERKTLKMTSIVALAFVFCWTPYAFVVLWFQFDKSSFQSNNSFIKDILFVFAVLNSVINPCVYSTHLLRNHREPSKVSTNNVIRGTNSNINNNSRLPTRETFF